MTLTIRSQWEAADLMIKVLCSLQSSIISKSWKIVTDHWWHGFGYERCVITLFSTVTACCFFFSSFFFRRSCVKIMHHGLRMRRICNTYRTRIHLIFMRTWNHVWKIKYNNVHYVCYFFFLRIFRTDPMLWCIRHDFLSISRQSPILSPIASALGNLSTLLRVTKWPMLCVWVCLPVMNMITEIKANQTCREREPKSHLRASCSKINGTCGELGNLHEWKEWNSPKMSRPMKCMMWMVK